VPTPLSPTDVSNISLSKVGAQRIVSLTDATNRSSIACNDNLVISYLEVARSARWNCLLTPAQLTAIPQTPINANPALTPVTPWGPNTAYPANTYVTYGQYYYVVNYAYTSSDNFNNDVTNGALAQTDQSTNSPFTDNQLDQWFGNLGAQYPSGWAFEYALPSDFQLMAVLNGNEYWDFDSTGGDEYEIMGTSIYTNCAVAVIQYVQSQPDTTRWDSLMTDAVSWRLAAAIATPLRQDGGRLEAAMMAGYDRSISKAVAKNSGEKKPRRFSPIRSSRFLRARFTDLGSSNGGD
jgi:hypothetical protein